LAKLSVDSTPSSICSAIVSLIPLSLSFIQGLTSSHCLMKKLKRSQRQQFSFFPTDSTSQFSSFIDSMVEPYNALLDGAQDMREGLMDQLGGLFGTEARPPTLISRRTMHRIKFVWKHLQHFSILSSHLYLVFRYQSLGRPGKCWLWGLALAYYLTTKPTISWDRNTFFSSS